MLDDDDDNYDNEEEEDDDDDTGDNNQNNSNDMMEVDFFDHEPTIRDKMEMRKASKPPSEWLNLLCREWANENQVLVETTDAKFLDYKPYLKGLISSQLLCRLSIPAISNTMSPRTTSRIAISAVNTISTDFWEILGIRDSFDRSYIVAQIERFCSLYSIRAISLEDISEQMFATDDHEVIGANMSVSPSTAAAVVGNVIGTIPSYMNPSMTATPDNVKVAKNQSVVIHKTVKSVTANSVEGELNFERRPNFRLEQSKVLVGKKEQKHREKEESAARKASDRAVREAEREFSRRRKLELREKREKFAQQQKEAALKRAAELVTSNRVPIEITRGVAAARAAQLAIQAGTLGQPPMVFEGPPPTKKRSAVIVSVASDLHQIVIHSKNLWAKYNAIAKEHNQKVCWITVARELGINVKVREKYSRMHARAEDRGFDWLNHGHWKIKDHPEIFLYPTHDEQKAKMPQLLPDHNRTVLISNDDEIAAAAAVVVDASVTYQGSSNVGTNQTQLRLTTPGALCTDLYNIDEDDAGIIEHI